MTSPSLPTTETRRSPDHDTVPAPVGMLAAAGPFNLEPRQEVVGSLVAVQLAGYGFRTSNRLRCTAVSGDALWRVPLFPYVHDGRIEGGQYWETQAAPLRRRMNNE